MIDRFGNPIIIGWPAHHVIYLEAALSLPRSERAQAFQDIAELTGRALQLVRDKAYKIERERMRKLVAPTRMVMVPARTIPCRPMKSELKPISKAKLMGGR